MSLISVQNVSKIFRQKKRRALLGEKILGMFRKQSDGFHALNNVSFRVEKEESVALIGANGAGKSTMLSLICGLAEPDEGAISVQGTIAPLLELGSGFHPDLTGRENLFLNAALLGLNERQSKERYEAIVDFSEIGAFITEPLRTYSAGMVLRLAFSVAVHCDPAILIIDEVLAVGDAAFQEKSFNKILQMRESGKTLLCVSHSLGTLRHFCNRAIWLHQGRVIRDGATAKIVDEYSAFMADPHRIVPEAKTTAHAVAEA